MEIFSSKYNIVLNIYGHFWNIDTEKLFVYSFVYNHLLKCGETYED